MFETLKTALAGRYQLDRELGRGGFAVVYLAHDVRHDRPVALKVLHEEVAASLGTDRFEREIKLAARLQHPHILTVYDSGEAAGRLWFTMPFVEGESLRDRLDRERQLGVDEACRIAVETADALDYAHRHGVVHRDIKPENILLSEDHALVADFGIARALSGEGSLTQTGMAVGTPYYMSPEQAAGEKQLDGRADLYALGCVLYEMLAGEPPYTGPTAEAILARAMTEAPRRLQPVRAAVPAALDDVIARAMARTRADRYATAAEFARAIKDLGGRAATATPIATPATSAAPASRRRLNPVLAVFVLGLLIGVGGLFAWRRNTGDHGARRLAVLPFENEGPDSTSYFADGMTDEVRGRLASIPGLQVTARSSANQYQRTTKNPEQIGGELGVEYLLTGTVRWETSAGGVRRVRVSPELVQVSTGSTRWQATYDTTLSDVFQLQAGIATRVAQELDIALGASVQQRVTERPTRSNDAHDAFLRGEALSGSMSVSDAVPLRRALGFYEQAVALDSNFVGAWAQLARAACSIASTAPTVADVEKCRAGAERALALGPTRPEGHMAMGSYLGSVKHDLEGAHEQYTIGLQADPRNAELLSLAAGVERRLGRFDEGLNHLEQAVRLDPKSVITLRSLGRALHEARRWDEARTQLDRALAIAPTNLATIQLKASTYLSQGDLPGARAVIATALRQVDTVAVVIRFATFQEMMWVLPDDLRPRVVRLKPADFDNDRGMWALKVGATWRLMGDSSRALAYGDSSAAVYEGTSRVFADDAQQQELLARALALAGRKAEAVRAGERDLSLRETGQDVVSGAYYKYQVARVYIQAGQLDRALDLIEPLLHMPGDLTPGWLRIDPIFAPLRGNPRYERLIRAG